MLLLDHSYDSPADNLACDEALLQCWEDDGRSDGLLRLWESPTHFVVLGLSNAVSTETNEVACKADNVPILRRCSGGGTVLQGPGSLNYGVILPVDRYPVSNISETNDFVMGTMQKALSKLIPGVHIQGHTDLTLNDLKFSGNAQRRLKNNVLFHGTVLYSEAIGPFISKYLAMPSKQPDYREGRTHDAFISPFTAHREDIKSAIIHEWGATKLFEAPNVFPDQIRQKYQNSEWHYKIH